MLLLIRRVRADEEAERGAAAAEAAAAAAAPKPVLPIEKMLSKKVRAQFPHTRLLLLCREMSSMGAVQCAQRTKPFRVAAEVGEVLPSMPGTPPVVDLMRGSVPGPEQEIKAREMEELARTLAELGIAPDAQQVQHLLPNSLQEVNIINEPSGLHGCSRS